MRKIFTFLTMCLLATAVWGQTEITFIPGETDGNNVTAQGADQMSKDGITVSTDNGGLKAAQYRFAKGSTTTFTSTIGNILKIEFTCSASGEAKYGPGCFAPQAGYSYEGNVGTWTGSATSVQFKAESNQVRATKIVVTVDGGGLSEPTINPAGGTYYAPVQVTMTCGTNGAKIYYTLNGSNPTTASTQFTAPFTVSSNTTVKAISAKDGETSDVVTAVYEFGSATPVENIAAFQNTANDVVVTFTNPVNVLAQNRSYLYVRDDSGYALFYGQTGQTYKNGDVIPAGFAGTKVIYSGEPELQVAGGFNAASGNNPIDPEEITADEVGHSMFAHYVILNGATIAKVDDRNYQLTDADGNTCAIYFGSMGVSAPSNLDATYDVIGIVGSYGSDPTIYQLLPTSIKSNLPGIGLGNLGDVADNTDVTIDYDATVLGQIGSYLYLKDETGYGLVYGQTGKTYDCGDVIPAGFGGLKTTYDNEPELKNPVGFQTSTSNIGGMDELNRTAENISPSAVAHETWGHYVKLTQVYIDTQNKTFTDANGNSCPYYDRFGIAFPDDTSIPYDVYGIVGSYGKTNTVYQLLPTKIDFTAKPVDVASINELYSKNEGVIGHFTTPLTTIYQNGNNLYVIDHEGTYSLVFGSVAYKEFANGDYVNDAQASWTTYNGNKQLKPIEETWVKAGHGEAVKPVVLPIEEISKDMVHWYLGFEDVTITENDGSYIMEDETGSMILYDRFNVLGEMDLANTHYIEGFLTVYRDVLELYPINPVVYEPEDVNKDGEVNVTDLNIVIDAILSGNYAANTDVDRNGEINLADVNRVIARILR